ncbi:MAG TPA: PEGA domain-containing protein [bacterium]|nr:PEGA domain-containing protein [bacterium]
MRSLRFGIALSLLLPAAAFAADEAPGVAILDVRPANGVTMEQAEIVRRAVSNGLSDYRVRVVEDHPAVIAAHGPGAEGASAPALTQARARAKEGKKLLDDLDPAGAEQKLRQAADLFEANAGALSSPADLIGTDLLLARVFFATEREVLARDIFRRVVQLQPDLTLDRAVYPPGMISVYEDVKKQVLSSPLGALNVQAVPSPAKVYLDGRDRGSTPLDLVNIVAGVHTLTVRRPGYAPWVRPVDVTTFRVDKINAELVLDRHPSLEAAFVPHGEEQKDGMGLTVGDYVSAVAVAANLDVVLLGRVSRSSGSNLLELRAYRASTKTWGEVMKFPFAGRPPRAFDGPAGSMLEAAAAAGWIPAIAARRNVAAGGGALDETARMALRLSVAPGVRVAGKSTNFPSAPSAGFRVGLDYRLSSRLLLSAETGFDSMAQSRAVLVDGSGSVVAPSSANIQSVYNSIPLDLGGRFFFGVGNLAPYATAGLGVRFDQLTFRESLPFDTIHGSSGLGLGAFAGAGFDYALGLRDGLFAESRVSAGTVGVGNAVLHTASSPPTPDRTLPVKPGLLTTFRISIGYLRVF